MDQEPLSPDEHVGEAPNPTPGTTPAPNVDMLKERLAKAEAQLSDIKKLAGVQTYRELKEKVSPKKEEPVVAQPINEQAILEHVALMNQGYTMDEISFVKRNSDGKPLTEAVKDQTIMAALEGIRAQKKAQDIIPEPSTRTATFDGKPFNDLSREEKSKNYAQTVDKLIRQGRGTRTIT